MTVETDGAIPPEVANQVVESATAALEEVEVAKQEADEVKVESAVPGLAETEVSFCERDVAKRSLSTSLETHSEPCSFVIGCQQSHSRRCKSVEGCCSLQPEAYHRQPD